jgi:PAS domain S-box-containing protein
MAIATPPAPSLPRPTRRPDSVAVLRSGEREFGIEELFFSTTDRKGLILSGNRVFTRVSGYDRAEMVGQPHSLIRHPDMPRAVFQLLWDEIGAGRPVAAYVKNLAKDGRPYWVLATVLPIPEGYLSVRLKPSTPLFAAAESIYAEVLRVERETESDPRRRKEAIEASSAHLLRLLAEAGFPDYGAFMRTVLPAEVRARDLAIRAGAASDAVRRGVGRPGHGGGTRGDTSGDVDPILATVDDGSRVVARQLEGLVAKLDGYRGLSARLAAKTEFLLTLADDIRLFSLNARIVATRGGRADAAIGAVASMMGDRSDASEPVFGALGGEIGTAVERLESISFPVAATRLQAEMAIAFVAELMQDADDARAAGTDLAILTRCMSEGVGEVADALTVLDDRIHVLNGHVRELQSTLGVMRALETNGRIEAVRSTDPVAVQALFGSIAEQIAAARAELDELSTISRISFSAEASEARRIRADVAAIAEKAGSLHAR